MIELTWDAGTCRAVPLVRCAVCRRPIEDADLAAVAWWMSDHSGEVFSGRPIPLHKGRCLDRYEADGGLPGTSFRWEELSHFILNLGDAVRLPWAKAARTLGCRLTDELSATASPAPIGSPGRIGASPAGAGCAS